MVRLLIPFVGIFLVWLLFFSGLQKPLRIQLSVVVVLITMAGLWFANNGKGLSNAYVMPEQVLVCGVEGEFSYRTNYNITLCLRNLAEQGIVNRIEVVFSAQQCQKKCDAIVSKTEEITVLLPAGQQIQHIENLAFDELSLTAGNLQWSAKIEQVWSRK